MKNGAILLGILILVIFSSGCQRAPCTDSDGGINYYQQGTVAVNNQLYTDYCINNEILDEYYCINDTLGNMTYNCPNICRNGTCVNMTPINCTDSDGGLNYYVKGNCTVSFDQSGGGVSDYCLSAATLRECYCVGNNLEYQDYFCPICYDGACINMTGNCTDSDGGINYYQQGTVVIDDQHYTDYCLSNETLNEYYCMDNESLGNITHTCFLNGICEDGRCVNRTMNCTDSDGGINYYVRGYVEIIGNPDFGTNGRKYDFCRHGNRLQEYVCLNGVYEGDHTYLCPDICQNGACVNTTGNCTDSDGGIDYYQQGTVVIDDQHHYTDYCITNEMLDEYYCISNTLGNTTYACPNGCEDGACINMSGNCTDSDGGLNYYQQGTVVVDNQFLYTDYCHSNERLNEYYCVNNSTLGNVTYYCENNCTNGACIN